MKALVLVSGGLDSFLALKILQEQGIEALGVHFLFPFGKSSEAAVKDSVVQKTIEKLGTRLIIGRLGQEYLEIVKNPEFGYGKNLNPCIDCKIMMLRAARQIMPETEAKFIASGEVLGQRPMSQNRQALDIIERESGLKGLLLRPLSARCLRQTRPEQEGWVRRESLLDIRGRSRKVQIRLAEELGITDYLQPAGGCLLTDAQFCRRLKDLWQYGEYDLDGVALLKTGRHFRLDPEFKLIVGRDEAENHRLRSLARESDLCFEAKDIPSPLGIGRGRLNPQVIEVVAQIISRYASANKETAVEFARRGDSAKTVIISRRINERRLQELMI